MSHEKDIDEQMSGERELLLLDLLYGDRAEGEESHLGDAGEAAEDSSGERADERAGQPELDGDLQSDLEAFTNLRALFRELPDEEPSPAITTKLLHAAALHAPKPASAADDGKKPGFFGWLAGLFQPIITHPGLAAAASLILIVAVTGTVYMSGKNQFAEPELAPSAVAPAPVTISAESTPEASTRAPTGAAADERDPNENNAALEFSNGSVPKADSKRDAEESAPEPEKGRLDQDALNKSNAKRTRSISAGKKSARRSKKARSARPYEGKPIGRGDSMSGNLLGDDSVGERISTTDKAGAPAPEPKPTPPRAPLSIAVDEPADEEASRQDKDSEDATIAVQSQAPVSAPASDSAGPGRGIARSPAEKPAEKQAKAKKKRKTKAPAKRAGSGDENYQRVRSLHNEAKAAAADQNCSTVREAGARIQRLDASYYRNTFRRDKTLAKCFKDKSR